MSVVCPSWKSEAIPAEQGCLALALRLVLAAVVVAPCLHLLHILRPSHEELHESQLLPERRKLG